jgi:PAS domain S-box-containing protein
LDEDLRLAYLSDYPLEFGGSKPEDLLGKSWQEADRGYEDNEDWRRHLACLKARQAFRDFQYSCVIPDGSIRHFSASGMPVFDQAGHFKGYRGIGTDITDRKRVEEALREREAQLRGIMDNAPIEIVLKDTEGHYVLTNAQWQKNYNLTDEEAKGKTLHDFFPEEFAKPLSDHGREVMETGEAAAHEDKFPESDGVHDFLTITFPIRDTAGEVVNFGVIAVDITERKYAEEAMLVAMQEAEVASQAKSEFLANMSHELRTPLNAIIGFAEVVRNEMFGPVGNPKYKDYNNDIYKSAQHLLELITDVLDLSKVESGTDVLHEENIKIRDVTRDAFRLVQQRAEEQGVELNLELSDELPALQADERKLKQILANLLSNAVKFTEAGGKVTLRAWCRADSGYVFQVVDTGIGIALNDIPKALSQFGQVESVFSRQRHGTGLGIPLTKALVEMHGGSLDLQSEVGVGTTVTVRFPAERIVRPPGDTRTLGTAGRKTG